MRAGFEIEFNAFEESLTTARRLDQLGLHWESWLDEGGTGQFELNLEPAEALATADAVTQARVAIREVAEEQGHCVTFMAK
ncbi:MAG: glutamine synthetase [Actinomycetia bacterium]|nr:glutamine synthetase [Actinomycetes bacterium]